MKRLRGRRWPIARIINHERHTVRFHLSYPAACRLKKQMKMKKKNVLPDKSRLAPRRRCFRRPIRKEGESNIRNHLRASSPPGCVEEGVLRSRRVHG